MERRSTNDRFVHYLGDIVSNVDSSHGVTLRGGSTGGIIETLADDTNAALTIRAKNAAPFTVGNSSNRVTVAGSTITMTSTFVDMNSTRTEVGATSTTGIVLIQRYPIDFTPAALAASTNTQSTVTVVGLTTNSVLAFTPRTPGLSAQYAFRVQCSTADELRLTQQNIAASTIGTGESTASGWLLQIGLPL